MGSNQQQNWTRDGEDKGSSFGLRTPLNLRLILVICTLICSTLWDIKYQGAAWTGHNLQMYLHILFTEPS